MAEINFARLQAVIQNMSAGVLSTDREQRILWANESFSRITGHALDEVIGQNPIELLLAPSADRGVADQLRARLASFEHFEGEVPLRRKGGVLRWVHLSTQPIVDAAGRCTEYVAVLTDVTQRRDADEALRRSNLLLEATQTIAQVGGWALELETRTLSWSAETFRIHETSPQQYQPELATALAFYAPESRPAIESAMRRAMEMGEDYDMELQVITARGRRLWVQTTGRVSRDGERIVRISGAIRDVTGRRLAEAALRASESRLRSMVDHAPMGIMLCDPDGRVSYVNDALLRMCGLARDDVQRAGSRLTVHPDDLERLARDWGAIRGRGLPFASEGRYLRPDGSVVWFEATTAPIVVDAKLASHVVMVQDVTAQLSLEREVVEAAGREQDRLGMELHDGLGQELTGLAISLASLVRKAEKFANPLRKDLREMAVLSSHSVAVCRQIAQGLAPMQLARGGLRNALRALAASARSIHGVQMRCSVRGLGDRELPSNTAHQLYRISQEAISNAIRHGQATRIELRVSRDDDRLQLLVLDNGCGMTGDAPTDGIGLHTMRYRAKMIGAEFDVGARPAGGVRVRCTLRLGAREAGTPDDANSAQG